MRAVVLALAGLLFVGSSAAAVERGSPPQVRAASYVVVGHADGRVLAARDADAIRPIASITKLMTVLVALERLHLDDRVLIGAEVAQVGESTLRLRQGERILVRDLAIGALVPSANDAALALALQAGRGSMGQFLRLMNARAKALGMRDTRFANPHGLDQPGHVSSARDVVKLLAAALRDPFIRRYASVGSVTLDDGRTVTTTDGLVGKVAGLVGAKTGYTSGAGWSQVATVTRGPVSVTVALLGAPSEVVRDSDLEALIEWGMARYVRVRAVTAGSVYATAECGWGLRDVGLVAEMPVLRTVAIGYDLTERVVAPAVVELPVRAGDRLGEITLLDGERVVARVPLVADRTVERPGLVARVRWHARQSVRHVVERLP